MLIEKIKYLAWSILGYLNEDVLSMIVTDDIEFPRVTWWRSLASYFRDWPFLGRGDGRFLGYFPRWAGLASLIFGKKARINLRGRIKGMKLAADQGQGSGVVAKAK
jgi:hypothetical protein